MIFKAILDPGDEVIVLAPYFVEYLFYADNHGGVARVAETDANFQLDLKRLAEALGPRTRAVIINSPNNPTGQVYAAAALLELGRLLAEHQRPDGRPVYLVADEPYRRIVYDGTGGPQYLRGLPRHPAGHLVFQGPFHPRGAPGLCGGEPPGHLGARSCGRPGPGQPHPGVRQRPGPDAAGGGAGDGVAWTSPPMPGAGSFFAQVLSEAGYEFFSPKGAFYLFPKAPGGDDLAFVARLKEENILAVPGRGFGRPGYFRLAFCVPETVIAGAAAGFARAARG